MTKLSKEELLEELDTWKRLLIRNWVEQDERAYQQITALVEKLEVTEEWIEEKVEELSRISFLPYSKSEARSFIRSLIEDVHVL